MELLQWNSLVANNMTYRSLDKHVDTALAMGALKQNTKGVIRTNKGAVVSIANLETTLSQGWATNEVLMATFDKYGNYTQKVFEHVQETGDSAYEAMQK